MLRTGSKVKRMTKRVGQASPTGTITALRGDTVEVRWDDGHVSVVSRISVVPVHPGDR